MEYVNKKRGRTLVIDMLGLLIRNKKKIIIFLCVPIIILIIIKIYYSYYFIDFNDFSETRYNGTYLSPNEEYSVSISINIPRNGENEYYVVGQLTKIEFIAENNQLISDDNTHIVYFDKRKGNFLKKNIYVKWINNTEFQIEDKKIRIGGKVYDYRRNLS